MRVVAAVVAGAGLLAMGCDGAPTNGAVDASPAIPDGAVVSNPPLMCPTSSDFIGCTEPLPSLAGTWKFSPSTTQTITLTATMDPAVLAGMTSGVSLQMMHLFNGDWHVEATVAWTCRRNGSARTLSSICKRPSGEIGISGDTRVPGFHTSYETTEYYSGVLVP